RVNAVLALVLAAGSVSATPPLSRGPAAGGAPAPQFVEIPGGREFSGELIVRPRQDLVVGRSNEARARLQGLIEDYYPEVDEYTIRIPDGYGAKGEAENRFAAELMATGDYQYVHPNWICYPVATPNDTHFVSQWHHQM